MLRWTEGGLLLPLTSSCWQPRTQCRSVFAHDSKRYFLRLDQYAGAPFRNQGLDSEPLSHTATHYPWTGGAGNVYTYGLGHWYFLIIQSCFLGDPFGLFLSVKKFQNFFCARIFFWPENFLRSKFLKSGFLACKKKIPEIFECKTFKARKFLANAIFLWENFLSPYVHLRLRLCGFSHFFSWSDEKIFVLQILWDVFFLSVKIF